MSTAKTPKFDAFVKKFEKVGLKIEVQKIKMNSTSPWDTSLHAVIRSGEWENYSLVSGYIGRDGGEILMKNRKMTRRIFG